MDDTDARVLRFPTPKLAPIDWRGTLLDPEVQQRMGRELAAAVRRAGESLQETARLINEHQQRSRP